MATYEDGYKRGVESALDEMSRKLNIPWDNLAQIFDAVRKVLLTKKVTKWVVVLARIGDLEECVSQGRLWDSKSAAERYIERALPTGFALGVFPIEIEVPL